MTVRLVAAGGNAKINVPRKRAVCSDQWCRMLTPSHVPPAHRAPEGFRQPPMNTLLFNSRPVNQSRRRDYLRGASAILNLRGSTSREYDFSSTPEEADAKALGNDWAVVGATLEDVIVGYRGTDE